MVGPWLLDNVSSSTWYYAVRAYAFSPSRVVQWDPELVTTILPTIVYDESYRSASFEWQFSLWLSLVEQNGFWPSHYGNLTFKSTSSASPFEILLPFRALTHTHKLHCFVHHQTQSTLNQKQKEKKTKQNEAFILLRSFITRNNAFESSIRLRSDLWSILELMF